MTCIVGYLDKKNDCVWIGGDSLGSNGYTQAVQAQAKVFRHDIFKDVIMGSTSTFRHIDLLKYSDNLLPELDYYKHTEIDHKYMVKTFIPNLINLFQLCIKHENETDKGGNFILGVKNKLFEIQGDYSVLEPASGFTAVGCGEVAALASMVTTTQQFPKLKPVEHFTYALEAAEKTCCGVQRPFIIINTKNPEEVIRIE